MDERSHTIGLLFANRLDRELVAEFLHLGTLSFERVNDLLYPRQHDPLVRGRGVKPTRARLR